MTGPRKSSSPRVVRRKPQERPSWSWSSLNPAEIWNTLRTYFGLGRAARPEPIDSPEALGRFLNTRASFIAQTSLYGYLRTRAGMRYPELFDDDEFVVGVNYAKWHNWLDCLGDLSVYAGSRLAQVEPRETARVSAMIAVLVDGILAETGTPPDAGPEFTAHAERLRDRLRRTDWLAIGEAEGAFTESPASVVRWAPVMDELKELDEEVVLNSVRFRWQEVRRHFARDLDLEAMLAALRSRDWPTR
jgi:hypothetical protein